MEIPWIIDEHTRVKHALLKQYIDAWMTILFSAQSKLRKPEKLIYIDGFAGPGVYYENKIKDETCIGSPLIVAEAANKYIDSKPGREVHIYCTENNDSCAELLYNNLINQNKHKQNWVVYNQEFSIKAHELLDELEAKKLTEQPIFFFIDPFGYSGYPISLLKRILQYPRAEVFINFMIYDIARFYKEELFEKKMVNLFGNFQFKKDNLSKKPEETYSFLKNLYCENLKKIANVNFIMPFRINTPGQGTRPRYYMIHASNNYKALFEMKNTMARVSESSYRFEAIGIDSRQISLFDDPDKINLIERVKEFCQDKRQVSYDDLEYWAYVNTNGISRTIKEALLQLEKDNYIKILRQSRQRSNTVTTGATILANEPPLSLF